MPKKINLTFGLTSTALFIAGCGMSVEDVQESTDQLATSFDGVIQTHEQLFDHESNMNAQFEEVLAQDEDLATIRDESASVVQNIQDRESILEEAQSQIETITENVEFLTTYDGKDISAEVLEQASSEFAAFTSDLEAYYTKYQESLDTQRNYLNEIAAEDANYQDFANGLDTVNEEYAALQETTIAFDDSLAAFEEQLNAIEEQIAAAQEGENAALATTVEANEETEEPEENAEESDQESTEDAENTPQEDLAYLTVSTEPILRIPDEFPQKFVYDSGVDIEYPEEGVKGIFVTAHSAGGDRMTQLTDLLNSTDLNSMVIDVKDDYGNITMDLNSENELVNQMTNEMVEAEPLMNHLEENDIYPIARIVVFKDTLLANEKPEWSFTRNDGSVWANGGGDSFVNPYLKEVWDYNIEVAKQAAKLGFKDIQFDYVRFPEGFETRDRELNYGHGHYGSDEKDVISMEYRNQAVTDFVAYAREQLQPYGVDVSVDIFGYAAVVRETPGIGQSFPGIAKEVDVISSMIYPSHWGPGNLDVAKPDLEPYKTVNNYMEIENEVMDELGEDAPVSRPWIQDFTASYLGAGNYKNYGAQEVTAQIQALHDNGVNEFLLWNAGNVYSEGATYTIED